MARLIARSPLGGATFVARGISVRECPDLGAWLITRRDEIDLLIVGGERPADPPGTALVQDMSSALTFIEVTGEGTLDLLGLTVTARGESGETMTRMGDLRVFVAWRRSPECWVRIGVERSSADYFWQWTKHRIEVGRTSG